MPICTGFPVSGSLKQPVAEADAFIQGTLSLGQKTRKPVIVNRP